jgi:broad specificity phosphatase PhoE
MTLANVLPAPNINDDWRIHMRRAWQDFDYVLAHGESSCQAQHRVLRVVDDLRARHEAGTIVAACHGNLIALALHAMANGIDPDFWKAVPLRLGTDWNGREPLARSRSSLPWLENRR